MKILTLNAAYHHGGASIHAMDVCKGLSAVGHEVVYCTVGEKQKRCLQDGYRVEILEQKNQYPIYHYFNPYIVYKLRRLLIEQQPDILHFHNINLQSFSLASLFFSKQYPLVWTLHDVWPICMVGWPEPNTCNNFIKKCSDCPNWPQPIVNLNRFIKESAYQLNDFTITCPSQWMYANLKKSRLNKKTIEVIPLGIDPDVFKSYYTLEFPNDLSLPSQKKVILFAGGKKLTGNLPAWRKGWKILCAALELLKDMQHRIHLLYVGDQVDIPEEISITATFVDNVSRNEMMPFYKVADLFVLPSMADNSPLTILEAMFCQTPIVASDIGGITELIEDEKSGLLCSPTDSTGLSRAIRYLLNRPGEAKKMAEAGYARSERYHNFQVMIRRYEKLFDAIK